ncbi:MAG: hypothetical protein EOO29_53280 [Comamonadaceae bacterium]|nr:MAG: hypothetical protein EOO29_53280 [Comamonadaceae bacterium]
MARSEWIADTHCFQKYKAVHAELVEAPRGASTSSARTMLNDGTQIRMSSHRSSTPSFEEICNV